MITAFKQTDKIFTTNGVLFLGTSLMTSVKLENKISGKRILCLNSVRNYPTGELVTSINDHDRPHRQYALVLISLQVTKF
jgi:hypothetical protein